MAEQLRLRGTLKGHGGWVTQIATTPAVPDMILSASRGTSNYYANLNCSRHNASSGCYISVDQNVLPSVTS